jgi:CHRD domain
LSFSGLQANVTQSHIHVAQANVNGAIVVWLCQTAAAMDPVNAQTQQCPLQGGTITGTIAASDIRVVAAQGLSATLSAGGRFDRFVAAVRAGDAYANVHSAQSPGGESRGQIRVGGGHVTVVWFACVSGWRSRRRGWGVDVRHRSNTLGHFAGVLLAVFT